MRLSARLKMIADQIPRCKTVADIGTDHAYIPIYAVKNKLCERALASDLKKGPLDAAEKNIRKFELENSIEIRLGYGLTPIGADECDVVVISGMGGTLISSILSASYEKAKGAGLLLLQPNSAADILRKWLYEEGFEILSERLVQDAKKIYCIIGAKWSGRSANKDEFDWFVGEKVFVGNETLLCDYLMKKKKELDVIISGRSHKKDGFGTVEGPDVINGLSTKTCIYIRNRLAVYLSGLCVKEKGGKWRDKVR